eukprot:1158812-Pelagomonas_calceolata.AAC.2
MEMWLWVPHLGMLTTYLPDTLQTWLCCHAYTHGCLVDSLNATEVQVQGMRVTGTPGDVAQKACTPQTHSWQQGHVTGMLGDVAQKACTSSTHSCAKFWQQGHVAGTPGDVAHKTTHEHLWALSVDMIMFLIWRGHVEGKSEVGTLSVARGVQNSTCCANSSALFCAAPCGFDFILKVVPCTVHELKIRMLLCAGPW